VKQHLKKGGVVTQWIPMDQQSSRLDRALLKAMTDVFKHVSLYLPSRLHGIAVASDEPLEEDAAAWATQLASPTVQASLHDIGFDDAEQVQGTLFLREAALAQYVGDVDAVTDDHPSIEHFLFEWDKQFDVSELLAQGTPSQAEKLRALAAQAARNHAFDDALALSKQADALLPGNRYGDFLRELEYGCLVPR
jgi:spermidine synthase